MKRMLSSRRSRAAVLAAGIQFPLRPYTAAFHGRLHLAEVRFQTDYPTHQTAGQIRDTRDKTPVPGRYPVPGSRFGSGHLCAVEMHIDTFVIKRARN